MIWLRAIGVWALIAIAESISGTARQLWLLPAVGERTSQQIGVVVGSLLILAIACLSARWLAAQTRRQQLAVGALWIVLMLLFEFGLGAALGVSRERMFAGYDVSRGGLMVLGILVLLIAPMLGAWWAGDAAQT